MYDHIDLLQFALARQLSEDGLAPRVIQGVIDHFREVNDGFESPFIVVSSSREKPMVYLADSAEEAAKWASSSGTSWHVVNLKKLFLEVSNRMRKHIKGREKWEKTEIG